MTTPKMPPNMLPYGTSITLEQAKRVMEAAEKEAEKQGWPMVIAIVDTAGQLVMFTRHDQAQTGSILIAQKKAETAAQFRRATKVFQEAIAGGGVALRTLAMPNVLPLEGGLPIVKDGFVIGGIGVSGMQSDQDAQVAQAGLTALTT
jgi:glc operon protein GlcG